MVETPSSSAQPSSTLLLMPSRYASMLSADQHSPSRASFPPREARFHERQSPPPHIRADIFPYLTCQSADVTKPPCTQATGSFARTLAARSLKRLMQPKSSPSARYHSELPQTTTKNHTIMFGPRTGQILIACMPSKYWSRKRALILRISTTTLDM
jgi:hypothetical protein